MSDELNLEAKRDWPEDYTGGENQYECKCSTCGNSFFGHKRRVTCKACTAPVSAPLDTQALPPPDDDELRTIWRLARRAGNSAWASAECETTMDEWHKRKIYEAIEAKIRAPYAARIAHLERELELAHCAFIGSENARKNAEQAAEAERKPVSIDTPEFRALEADFVKATIELSGKDHHADNSELFAARAALIAYIDGRGK
jgi:hypothetical protein